MRRVWLLVLCCELCSCIVLECNKERVITVSEPLEIEYPGEGRVYGDNLSCNWTFRGYGPLGLTFTSLDLDNLDLDCGDYVVAAGVRVCHNVANVTSLDELDVEFVSDGEGPAKGFVAVVENVCPRFGEKCEFLSGGSTDPETLLVYTAHGAPKVMSILHDLQDLFVDAVMSLEVVLFGDSVGSTVCHNCRVKAPQSSVPSCHAESQGECAWVLGPEIYLQSGNPGVRGDAFVTSVQYTNFRTADDDLDLDRVCVSVQHSIEKGNGVDLLLSAEAEGRVVFLKKTEVVGKGEWGVSVLAADVPQGLAHFGLVIEVANINETGVLINKIAGCDTSAKTERVVIFRNESYHNRLYGMNRARLREKRDCLNGGRWHEGRCVCLPGFAGGTCQEACGPNKYGRGCEAECGDPEEGCRGKILCKRNMGCHCAPGYHGLYCNVGCPQGEFGAGCMQRCGFCVAGCDPYSGACLGPCLPGYVPPTCHHKYAHFLAPPVVEPGFTYAAISAVLDDYTTDGVGRPEFFCVQYRKEPQKEWSRVAPVDISESPLSYNLTGLEPGHKYHVRIVLHDGDMEGYYGEDVPSTYFETNCTEKSTALFVTDTVTTADSITISWEQVAAEGACPLDETLVQICVEGNCTERIVSTTNFTFGDLKPDTEYKLRLKPTNEQPFKWIRSRTLNAISGRVESLRATRVTDTTVELKWEAVGKSSYPKIYEVTYECVRLEANARPCYNDSGSKTVHSSKVTLWKLSPYRTYSVRVSERPGEESSEVRVTTKSGLPLVKPVLRNMFSSSSTATVSWSLPEDCGLCNGRLEGYLYKVKDSEGRRAAGGYTNQTWVVLQYLEPSTDYNMQIFIRNDMGWNGQLPLKVEFQTKDK